MSVQEDIVRLRTLNQKLSQYEWFISPYYSWAELTPLEDFLQKNPYPEGEKEKLIGSMKISDLLVTANMNFRFRAMLMCEGYMIAPNTKKFSHVIEVGLFEFYSLNFITCSAVWIPTVEGIIRSLLKWQGTKRPNLARLRSIKASDKCLQSRVEATADAIVPFLDSTLFRSLKSEKVSPVSNFNRHLFTHMFSSAPWYSRSNCLRLLNVLDSLLSIDLMESGLYRPLFEGKSERVKKREAYYEFLLDFVFTEAKATRMRLLNEHSNFKDFHLNAGEERSGK